MKPLFKLAISLILVFASLSPAHAVGSRPILNVNCGNLLTLTDQDGQFKYFNPTVLVSYWGKYLKYTVYESPEPSLALKDQSKMYGTETRDNANAYTFGTSDFNWSKQLRFDYFNTSYTSIYMVVKDSMNRSASMRCA